LRTKYLILLTFDTKKPRRDGIPLVEGVKVNEETKQTLRSVKTIREELLQVRKLVQKPLAR
jgi:hypothetical protein